MQVVLLHGKDNSSQFVQNWLARNGFVTWQAKDLCDVFEELSDYTVGTRPDVVVLEVGQLPETLDEVTSAFRNVSGSAEINVLALSDVSSGSQSATLVARNLEQLKSMIGEQMLGSRYAA